MAPITQLVILLISLCSVVAAECANPGTRKAWHRLSNSEKLAYINAELCLMGKPASRGMKGAKSRFDEFQAVHQLQAYSNHYVGSFLPYHRLFVQAHETALRTECNYTGYQPYWEETRDAGNFRSSILLDATYGFGGDGSGPSSCITTGPFANYTNSIGPGYQITNHCIDRRISDLSSTGAAASQVNNCLAKTEFTAMWPCLEALPHSAGHAGIGGQMQNGVSSPGDPIFWLHHAWLDKLFWDWQVKDRAKRTVSIGGTNIGQDYAPGFPPRPASIPKATGADGDPGTTTTLGHILNMYGNGPNKTIADVMDIQGAFLCYEYAQP